MLETRIQKFFSYLHKKRRGLFGRKFMRKLMLLVVLGAVIFSIHWGNIVILMLTIFCLNFLIAGFISIFYSFIKTERQAGAVLSSVIIVMSLLGGSMVSVTQFPPLFQKISKITVKY